jgi:hypothetical protein
MRTVTTSYVLNAIERVLLVTGEQKINACLAKIIVLFLVPIVYVITVTKISLNF